MRPFTFHDPKSAAEATALLAKAGAQALGGGVDLLGEMKEGIRSPEHLVNLRALKGLDAIEKVKDAWRIGATSILSDIAEHPGLKKDLPGLCEAALAVATPQIRNQGTLGGNLAQRPRCWYYRSAEFGCAKKGGQGCPAKEGENKYHAVFATDGPCVITHPSDCAPMLVALDAKIILRAGDASRTVAAADFYELPAKNILCEFTLKPGEFIEAVEVPTTLPRSTYIKLREKDSFDFALAACAVAGKIDGDHFTDVRVVLGGVAPIPWRCGASESNLLKSTLADGIEPAANAAIDGAKPLALNAYKIPLIKAAVSRALRTFLK